MKLPSSWKVIAFTVNLLIGLLLSQILGAFVDHDTFHVLVQIITFLTMWALSYIMINVGYEFTIDKGNLSMYLWDYLIAMTAAGFPWVFVAVWFLIALAPIGVDVAFLVARFAAPTSAGILFSMLEAAGLRETWVFQKARVLAIFDDLDTILLMIPLKIMMIGFKWELCIVVAIMVVFLVVAWIYLHALKLPFSWYWTVLYGLITAGFCKGVHLLSHDVLHMEVPIHIEVLLPAFVIGCIVDTPVAREELLHQQTATLEKLTKQLNEHPHTEEPELRTAATTPEETAVSVIKPPRSGRGSSKMSTASKGSSGSKESSRRLSRHGHEKEKVVDNHDHDHDEDEADHLAQTWISMVFMILVGLSMPPMFGVNAEKSDEEEEMEPGILVAHIVMVSFLMILGKMFPIFCYRDEAPLMHRLALCLGMCPRGEVGASIVVISLEMGVSGPAIIISMCALVINLVMSGGFIAMVKLLLRTDQAADNGKVAPEPIGTSATSPSTITEVIGFNSKNNAAELDVQEL